MLGRLDGVAGDAGLGGALNTGRVLSILIAARQHRGSWTAEQEGTRTGLGGALGKCEGRRVVV